MGSWSFTAGEKGRNRVRAFERDSGIIYLDAHWNGQRRRQSLGHSDREKAKEQAKDLAARLRLKEPEPESSEDPTLGKLFDKYLRERDGDVTEGRHETLQRVSEAMRRFFGSGRKVADLNRDDWDSYRQARRSGEIDARGHQMPERARESVGGRTVKKDLQVLREVCRWAVSTDLLSTDPTEGYPYPDSTTPRRPRVSDARYRDMLDVASDVGWRFRVALVLAHETGRRSKQIRRLRWSDVDLDAKQVRWRGSEDKAGHEDTNVLTDAAVEALREAREHRPGVGEAWILPNPHDPSRPATRHQLRRWWLQAEEAAGLEHVDGLGWHGLRRKLTDDLKAQGLPLKEIAAAGGWKEEQTVLRCYQSADRDRIRDALEQRSG